MKSLSTVSDESLVGKIRTHDRELYREIVNRYEKKLMRYATYILKNDLEAAEVVQDSFIKAYVNLNGFDTKKKFSSWIYRITHNEAMNYISKRKKLVSYDTNPECVGNITDTTADTQEDNFDKKTLTKLMEKCLSDLPLGYREPIIFYYYEDKSYDEISDILKVPINTVGTNISRGKRLLKEIYLKKEGKRIW